MNEKRKQQINSARKRKDSLMARFAFERTLHQIQNLPEAHYSQVPVSARIWGECR